MIWDLNRYGTTDISLVLPPLIIYLYNIVKLKKQMYVITLFQHRLSENVDFFFSVTFLCCLYGKLCGCNVSRC